MPLIILSPIIYAYLYSIVALQPYFVLLVGGLKARVIVQCGDTIYCNYSPLLIQGQLQECYNTPFSSVLCPP